MSHFSSRYNKEIYRHAEYEYLITSVRSRNASVDFLTENLVACDLVESGGTGTIVGVLEDGFVKVYRALVVFEACEFNFGHIV